MVSARRRSQVQSTTCRDRPRSRSAFAGIRGGRARAIVPPWMIPGIKWMRNRSGSRRVLLIEPLVDEEHLVGPRRKWRNRFLTTEVVLVKVRDVEKALQALDDGQGAFALDAMKLDRQLVDALQDIVG